MEKLYYILSKKYSDRQDSLVFWRTNSAGYCQRLDWAGKYTQEQIDSKHLNPKDNIAVPCEEVEALAVQAIPFDDKANKWFRD